MKTDNWKDKFDSFPPKNDREILEKSPLEAGAFQGEGFHVCLKSEPDFQKA